jgi:hypothetical protein
MIFGAGKSRQPTMVRVQVSSAGFLMRKQSSGKPLGHDQSTMAAVVVAGILGKKFEFDANQSL